MDGFDGDIKQVSESYDRTIEAGNRGLNPYDDLPESITGHPAYIHLRQGGNCSSGNPDIKAFLDPKPHERFLDLGCAANILNYRLHEWPCGYFGVDSSEATISLLENAVRERGWEVGGLYCAPADRVPFPDGSFHLAACVGILEYHALEYAGRVLREAHRVLEPGGRFYVDIPNPEHPGLPAMRLIEEHLGRPIKFRGSRTDFKGMLRGLFSVEREDVSRVMAGYFLRRL